MLILFVVVAWILGGLINLLADSLPYSRRPERPHCLSCGAPFSSLAWLSISARFVQEWRCSYCDSPRKWRAPIVELASILLAIILYHFKPHMGTIWTGLLVGSIYLLIVVIDIEHRLILHIVSGPAALIVGILGILDSQKGLEKTLLGGAVGFSGRLYSGRSAAGGWCLAAGADGAGGPVAAAAGGLSFDAALRSIPERQRSGQDRPFGCASFDAALRSNRRAVRDARPVA